MKRRFATRKYASRKFIPRRFAGLHTIIEGIQHAHYFILHAPYTIYNFILQQGQSFMLTKGSLIHTFVQTIKD